MKETNSEICKEILFQYTKGDSLRKHGIAVAACMENYAIKFNENRLYWKNVGLLHDFDYEMFPTEAEHPYKGAEILRAEGFEELFIDAIMSHTPYTGIQRDTLLKQTLFACDELAGFILAVSYVRPSKSLMEVEVKSVLKKMKDKAFARQVSREDIISGAEGIGLKLEDHIANCISALQNEVELNS